MTPTVRGVGRVLNVRTCHSEGRNRTTLLGVWIATLGRLSHFTFPSAALLATSARNASNVCDVG